ncbi:MAG: hypothetical protein MJ093_05710 [Saccharofermentans sp.]|nr:hypothetical protein [Saccharofermentans sp.]
MKKNEVILVIVTVILVVIIGIGFIFDKNEKVIKRTVGIEMTDNMKVVSMEKRGFLLYRTGYTAKIQIDYDNDPDILYAAFTNMYGTKGLFLSYEEYTKFASEVLDGETIKPNPLVDSLIFVLGVEDNNQYEVVYIMATEAEGEAYLYIYFAR